MNTYSVALNPNFGKEGFSGVGKWAVMATTPKGSTYVHCHFYARIGAERCCERLTALEPSRVC